MRWKRILINDLGPFSGEHVLDLEQIEGKVIAVTGANGAGKSTLLELLLGSLYRKTQTRGTLSDLARSRRAILEADIEYRGRCRTLRHTVDGESSRGESLVLDEAGEPVLKSAKRKDFDRWAGKHLPAADVLTSSSFAVQGRRGLLDLAPAPRKAVILEALGQSQLEEKAAQARLKARDAGKDTESARKRLEDEIRRGGDVDFATGELEKARDRLAAAKQTDEGMKILLASEQQAVEQARSRAQLARRWSDLRRVEHELFQRQEGIKKRREENRQVTRGRREIEAARRRRELLDADREQVRQKIAGYREDLNGAESRLLELRLRRSELEEQQERTRAAARLAEGGLADEDLCAEAAGRLPVAQGEQREAQAALDAAEKELARLRGLQLSGTENRVYFLREGLAEVATADFETDSVGGLVGLAARKLREDDEYAEQLETAPDAIHDVEVQLAEQRAKAGPLALEIRELEKQADRLGEMARYRTQIEASLQEARHRQKAIEELEQDTGFLENKVKDLKQLAAEQNEQLEQLVAEVDSLQPLLAQYDALQKAEALGVELDNQLEQVDREQAQLLAWFEEIGESFTDESAVEAGAELARAQASLRQQESRSEWTTTELHQAVATLTLAEEALTRAQESGEQQGKLKAELATSQRLEADWNRLQKDLGKDGLQAFEIDCAGPELTTLTNELLHSCHGPRFTVFVETTRMSADGKKELEGCEIRVIDSQENRDAPAETYSGGECVIVGEAMGLALTMLACRRTETERPTLVRDESGAALDPVNAQAYVAMLRMAAEIVGADKVLVVSHSGDVQALADARVELSGKRMEVRA